MSQTAAQIFVDTQFVTQLTSLCDYNICVSTIHIQSAIYIAIFVYPRISYCSFVYLCIHEYPPISPVRSPPPVHGRVFVDTQIYIENLVMSQTAAQIFVDTQFVTQLTSLCDYNICVSTIHIQSAIYIAIFVYPRTRPWTGGGDRTEDHRQEQSLQQDHSYEQSLLQGSFAKSTYVLRAPANCSHLILGPEDHPYEQSVWQDHSYEQSLQ